MQVAIKTFLHHNFREYLKKHLLCTEMNKYKWEPNNTISSLQFSTQNHGNKRDFLQVFLCINNEDQDATFVSSLLNTQWKEMILDRITRNSGKK